MRCFTSLVLGLLALEVVLARNLQEQVFNSVQSMCPDSSSEEEGCINCQSREACAQNTMCSSSSCDQTSKIVNIGVPKAGRCPWNPLGMLAAGICPKVGGCFSDSECSGNMKCCNVGCVMQCTPPMPGMQHQDPGTPSPPDLLWPPPYLSSDPRADTISLSAAKMATAQNGRRAWLPHQSTQPPSFRRAPVTYVSAPGRVEAVRLMEGAGRLRIRFRPAIAHAPLTPRWTRGPAGEAILPAVTLGVPYQLLFVVLHFRFQA
ncbi:uncharacterized protein LOC127696783 [Apodemus sylvaticus]|uniref:uncharacterized protein LOC127696783 n=1 Tax=Apodemus sylvaticus TaxID=10129 RepID=UPI00224232B7|nr:uncharacterized protein LOC127696783 [Apodemus sylvaticus]